MNNRNMSIELFRIFLMNCICMIHVVGKGGYSQSWLANFLKIGVPGFIFISGWFGVSFSWKKVIKLYALGAWCALVGALGWKLLGYEGFFTRWITDLRWFWFLHAYIVLLMVSPLLNAGLDSLLEYGRKRFILSLIPFAVYFFGWAYLFGVNHFRPFIFEVAGLDTHSPLTLVGIYIFERAFRMLEIEKSVKNWHCLCIFVFCLPFSVVGLGNYNSPTTFLFVMALFLCFKRVHLEWRWVKFISPSLFSIYLLHSTLFGLTWFIDFEDWLMSHSCNVYVMFFIVTSVVFGCSFMIDLVRRLCLNCLFRLKR